MQELQQHGMHNLHAEVGCLQSHQPCLQHHEGAAVRSAAYNAKAVQDACSIALATSC